MQDKNLNSLNDSDIFQEDDFVDISSLNSEYIMPDANDRNESDSEETDINQIQISPDLNRKSDKESFNSIDLAEDFRSDMEENSKPSFTKQQDKNNRYVKNEKFFSKHKIPLIISSAAVVVIAAAGVVLWTLVSNGIIPNPFEETVGPIVNEEGEFTYLSGIKISGIDISGKTYEEAKALLEENKNSFIKDFKLSVEANEKSYEFTPKDFTYTYNIEEVLNQAKKYCEDAHKGDIDVTHPATDEDGGYKDMYTVTAAVADDSIEAVVKNVAKETDVPFKNAYVSKFTPFSNDKFEYHDGTTGYKTDKDDLVVAIKSFINTGKETGTIKAKVDTVEPKITKEMVEKNIVPLSYYSTTSVNTENATYNMGTALDACNGSVIEPGETWSFNECTGDSNLESNGYLPAGVISDGSMTQGIGGGLCQASSTIYNAAIFANMEIIERYNHYWASVYVPAGLDATIDYPNLDLKLKNTTDYQMFIECTLDGRKLSCTIYGYQDPSYDDIATYSENRNIVSGESYDTVAYRVLYKDGKEVSREELPNSHYSLTEGHYVQYSDDGTHRQKPSGETIKTNNSSEENNKQEEVSNDGNNNNSSENNNSSSASSSKPASSSSSSSSSDNTPSSSSSSSSQAPPETQPDLATTSPAESDAGDENE